MSRISKNGVECSVEWDHRRDMGINMLPNLIEPLRSVDECNMSSEWFNRQFRSIEVPQTHVYYSSF